MAMMCLAWRGGMGAVRVAAVGALSVAAAASTFGQATCQTATPIGVGSAFVSNNSAAAANGPADACAATSADVWHTFVPSVAGQHTISLCGSSFDTVAAVYAGCGVEPLACSDDSCGLQSQIVVNLSAGQTYVLRVAASAATGGAGGAYRVQITSPASPPANNVCGSGAILPPNQTIGGSNAGASGNDTTGACGGTLDRNDVWFNFNPAASGVHLVELCSTAFDAVLSVHSSCFNAQLLGCSDNEPVGGCAPGAGARVSFVATAGSPVLIRVAGVNGGFGPFSLTMHTAQSNDSCDSPRPLVRGVAFTSSITPALATEGVASCATSANDAWHVIAATSTSPHMFTLCGSTFDTVLSVHRGCPGTPGSTELACSDDGCGPIAGPSQLVLNLAIGELYYVRVGGRVSNGQAARGEYTLRVDLAAPSNDACSSPIDLTEGVPVTGITYGASGTDITSCGNNDGHDVWYTFVPDHNGIFEINTCGSAMNTTLGLFSDCFNELACSDDEPAYCGDDQSTGSRIVRLLSRDTPYLLRVASASNIDGGFRLVVNRAPPPNDACAGAEVLTEGAALGATLSGASPSGFDACGGGNTPDAYFAFTPNSTRHYRISTCGSASKTTISAYASCPPSPLLECSSTAQTVCSSPRNTELTTVMRAGMTHYLRVAATADQSIPAGFQVAVEAVTPPNDDCTRAYVLSPDDVVISSNIGATGEEISPCGPGDTKDIWFQFTPELTGLYEFRTCAAPSGDTTPDTTLALFDTCGGTLLACSDDAPAGILCTGLPMLSAFTLRLEAGRDYLLRAAVVAGGEGVFMTGVRPVRPANDTCGTAQTVVAGVVAFDNVAADSDPTSMLGCGLGFTTIGNDVWFRYVAPSASQVIITSCGSGFDTAIAVLDGTVGCGNPAQVVACDDNYDCDQSPSTNDTASRAVFQSVTGRPYLIRVGSLTGERGPGELRISAGSTPVCACDWNHQDGRTVQDIFDFLFDWFSGQGDFNQSGASDLQDLFDFLACFLGASAGCA